MGAAVTLRDVIRKEQHVLVVGIVPPHRDLDRDAVALGADGDRLRFRLQDFVGGIDVGCRLWQAGQVRHSAVSRMVARADFDTVGMTASSVSSGLGVEVRGGVTSWR